ncbi:hypothetical protein VTK26DRAFT_292 [Humicola hyalothermophila]
MSRALDEETAASLKTGSPSAAYQAISNALALPSDGLLEIEILGKGQLPDESQYVLRDGRAVGISKLALVQAFLVARKLLMDHIQGVEARADNDILVATAIILLLDPEFLTAANTRKRLLQSQIVNCGDAGARLANEKRFVDSLLTSRLHRHTKSPTLWSHRRWLLTVMDSLDLGVDALGDITQVVFIAGERHPRNYYAWCHARVLVELGKGVDSRELLAAVRSWCFQHHTDISGWSFLYFLLNTEGCKGGEAACSTFTEVLNLVRSLRLANESVWVFLRTLAASSLLGDQQYSQFLGVQKAVLGALKAPGDQTVLCAAIGWCETYRQHERADLVDA